MDAFASYIDFLDSSGTRLGYAFHNFPRAPGSQIRTVDGIEFLWAEFGYTGAAVDINGANLESALLFAVSDLMLGYAQQADDNNWLVRVRSIWLDPVTLEETSDELDETYQITSYQHDLNELIMTLGSPLDAQSAEIPARVLSRSIVGELPTTGQLSLV